MVTGVAVAVAFVVSLVVVAGMGAVVLGWSSESCGLLLTRRRGGAVERQGSWWEG